MKLKKKEIIIFAVIVAAALIWWLVMYLQRSSVDYGSIRITVAGEEYGTYSLGKDQRIKINGTNTCQIRDGVCRMVEADCPDRLCMSQPSIDARGGMIVCLPNQVIIEGIPAQEASTDEGRPDAVS